MFVCGLPPGEHTQSFEMYLKKALWTEGMQTEKGSPENEAEAPATAVGELVSSLTEQRVYREVTLALRTGLRDTRAEFSFVRLRGLERLLKFLRSVAESDSTIKLFCRTQSVPELQGLDLRTSEIFLYFFFLKM